MGSSERLHLRWNDFESNIKLGFSELRNDEDFFDVTLACGSKQIKAHKVILSACSPFFRSLIKSLSHSHPLLYLRNVKSSHLESLLCFMYNGEVSVSQDELNDFLAIAEEFQIKGLSQNNSPSSNEAPPPSKRPRLPPPNKPKQPSSSKPPMTFTILDDGEVKEETTPKEEEENKFIPPNNEAAATNDESREYDQDFSDETMFESEEFIQESDYSNDNLEPELSGMPGSSGGLAQPNENKELNEKLNEEINRLIKKTSEGLYQCIPCKKTTKRLQNLQFHVESLHVITDGFECKVCGTVLKTRQYYRQHIKKHEKTPKYIPTRLS